MTKTKHNTPEMPVIEAVTVDGPMTLRIRWKGRRAADTVNLAGWVATGSDRLKQLKDTSFFAGAKVINYGDAVGWGDEDDDIAIDAMHLKMIAEEQRPFSNADVKAWQSMVNLSNAEAADLVGVRVSTWNTYRTTATIPQSIAITLRATLRDPLLLHAHLRPRTTGRPRKSAGA